MCQPAAPIEMKRRSMLCQSVSRVPPPPSGSSSQRMSCPPQLNSSTLGSSARFTCVSDTCGVPTVDSFTVPTVPRFRSESNGAHSRRCSGSVSAFHTLAGGWESSRTRTSVHLSPSLRTSAPEAAPGAYCSRLAMSFLSFHGRHLLHFFQVLLQRIDVPRPEAPEGNEPSVELHQRLGPQPIEALLRFDTRFDEPGLAQHPQVLGDRGLRQSQLLLDLAHRALGGEEQAQDGPAIGLRDDGERRFHGCIYTLMVIFVSSHTQAAG